MANLQAIGAQAHYEHALEQGRFEIQHCTSCHSHVFYPRQICPHCASLDLQWIQPSGLGRVYSCTTVSVNPKHIHDVVLIDLDEGVRMMSRVANRAPGETAIGQRVQARIEPQTTGPLVVFDAIEEHA